jgi:tetratricopeptide (TPR) repeat protein
MNLLTRSAALLLAGACATMLVSPLAEADNTPIVSSPSDRLSEVQAEWARINYQLPAAERAQAFEALARDTRRWVEGEPQRAEPLIWHGIVLSSQAGAQGGLGALSLAKEARQTLEKSLKIDESALQGSAHTSLATLYSKVPGFPIGFGNDKKAKDHFKQALAMNPTGIDANFFYAEYLADEGDRLQAIQHLKRALAAKDRPGRELADAGRRKEIQSLLTTIQSKK